MAFDETTTSESMVDSGDAATSADTAQPRVSEEAAASRSPASSDKGASRSDSEPTPDPGAEGEERESAASAEDAQAAKAAKADEYLALAQRTQADFENYRKRALREAAVAQERGAVRLALALLPAIDNLERALAHAAADGGVDAAATDDGEDSLVAGIRHVHSDVLAALSRVGIERYSPEGERFDPQYHEAVAQQPVEGAEPGVVVEVYQRGYRIGENVVRPARVVVAG